MWAQQSCIVWYWNKQAEATGVSLFSWSSILSSPQQWYLFHKVMSFLWIINHSRFFDIGLDCQRWSKRTLYCWWIHICGWCGSEWILLFSLFKFGAIDKCMRRERESMQWKERKEKKEIYIWVIQAKRVYFSFLFLFPFFPYSSSLWVTINLTIHLLRAANSLIIHLLKEELQVQKDCINSMEAGSALTRMILIL